MADEVMALASATQNQATEPVSVSFQHGVDELSVGFQRMHALRALAPHLCDVMLQARSTVKEDEDPTSPSEWISAHRIVLAATIPYFGDMFQESHDVGTRIVLSTREIEHGILVSLIDFAYTGTILIDHHNARPLLIGAAFLQLNTIRDACRDYLGANLTPISVLEVRKFAAQLVDRIPSMQSLVCIADHFSHHHIVAVAESASFTTIDLGHLIAIVHSDGLTDTAKETFYEAAMRWMQAQLTSPSDDDLSNLLATIRRSSSAAAAAAAGSGRKHHLTMGALPNGGPSTAKRLRLDGGGGVGQSAGFIYTIDSDTGRMEVFDPRSGWWRATTASTTARKGKLRYIALVEHGGLLYAFSGSRVAGEGMMHVEVFDPLRSSWRSHTVSLQEKRYNAGVCKLNGHIYMCGGSSVFVACRTVQAVACYSPETSEWRNDVAPMLQKRQSCGAGVLNGSLYVMGGTNNGQVFFNTVERYDVGENAWHQVSPMLNKRSGMAVAELDGKLYVCGGTADFRGPALSSMEMFDPCTGIWQRRSSMQKPRNRFQLVASQGKLWALGGWEGGKKSAAVNSTEMYDPVTDTWQRMAAMDVTTCTLLAAVMPTA